MLAASKTKLAGKHPRACVREINDNEKSHTGTHYDKLIADSRNSLETLVVVPTSSSCWIEYDHCF